MDDRFDDQRNKRTCTQTYGRRCIAVEMELAGVQSVCDFDNLKLYAFFEAGDILDTNGYEAKA